MEQDLAYLGSDYAQRKDLECYDIEARDNAKNELDREATEGVCNNAD